jgi:hypothetical protein
MVLEAAEGDLYLAEEGDYVVFLDATLEGENLEAPTGPPEHRLHEGTLHYSTSMTAINEPLTIEVPAEVLGATRLPEDIPLPDRVDQILGGEFMGMRMHAFLADDPPASVVSFYTVAMREGGWIQDTVEETGDAYRLEYSKGDRSILVDVSVEPDADKTFLAITSGGPDGLPSIFQGQ